MSLALSVTQSSGAAATFWILNSIHLNAYAHLVTIHMDGYVDSAAQASGCTPLVSVSVSSAFDPTHVLTSMSVMDALYVKIQLDPFFSGAVYTSDGL